MSWTLRVILILQVIAILYLQQRLWSGDGSFVHGWELDRSIALHTQENNTLIERNALLEADVNALKSGLDAIEEKARLDLGMIKHDETFFLIVD